MLVCYPGSCRRLDVSFNRLTSAMVSSVDASTALQSVDLSSNALDTPFLEGVSALAGLRWVLMPSRVGVVLFAGVVCWCVRALACD